MVLHFFYLLVIERECVLLTHHLNSLSVLWGLEVGRSDDVGLEYSEGDGVCVLTKGFHFPQSPTQPL